MDADEIQLILELEEWKAVEDEYEVEQWKAVEGEKSDAAEVEAMRRDFAEDEENAEKDVTEIAGKKRKIQDSVMEGGMLTYKRNKFEYVQDVATVVADENRKDEVDPAQRFEEMLGPDQLLKFKQDCREPNIILNLFDDKDKDVEDPAFTEEQDDELIMQLVAEEENAAAETNWQFKMVTAMKEAEHAAKEEAEKRKNDETKVDFMVAEADSTTEQLSGEGMEWKAEQFEVVNSDRQVRFLQECIASYQHTIWMIVEDGRKLRENVLLKEFYSKFLEELE